MHRVLIHFAHPAKSRSSINNTLRSAVEGLPGVTVNDLYARYPDFMIDVPHEQSLCESHDIIVFQHPFYWYSTPAIIKEWLDLVLQYGWAYGSTGNALQGKLFFQAISAGGDAETYQQNGYNQFTITELSSPYQATANLCKMIYLPPFAITGVHRGLPEKQLRKHAEDYQRIITALRDARLDIAHAKTMAFLNSDIDAVIQPDTIQDTGRLS